MQKAEILELLSKVNAHLARKWQPELAGRKMSLHMFGKSALLLAGLEDSVGTVDIDLLKVKGNTQDIEPRIENDLAKEFGKSQIMIHGYYLEFVGAGIPLLPHRKEWITLASYQHLSPSYLDPNFQVATKIFSACSSPSRKRDRQDVVAALDQGIADWGKVCAVVNEILREFELDARSDFFPDVLVYLEELKKDYHR